MKSNFFPLCQFSAIIVFLLLLVVFSDDDSLDHPSHQTKSFDETYGSAGINARNWTLLIISEKSTSNDDEETGIDKEEVEIVEEAENVSKGTKNDDKMIVNTHTVIFTV